MNIEIFCGVITARTGQPIDRPSNIRYWATCSFTNGSTVENMDIGRPNGQEWKQSNGEPMQVQSFNVGDGIIGMQFSNVLIWGRLAAEIAATGDCG